MATNNFTRVLKQFFTLAILVLFCQNILGQARDFKAPSRQKPAPSKGFKFDPANLVFGGNLGASFGDVTYVEVAPTAGYLFHPNYLAGISARYIYYEDRTFAPAFVYKSNIYGGGIFNQYYFLQNFLAHAEYEILNVDSQLKRDTRVNVHSVFLGGGYRSSVGGRSFISVLLLYNINDSSESPYSNPLLRLGFGVAL